MQLRLLKTKLLTRSKWMKNIEANIKCIKNDIKLACERSNRSYSEITVLAVTKTMPLSDMNQAFEHGLNQFAENKVQELLRKETSFSQDITWHLIGHLQTNKVKSIVGKVTLIHSVDSYRLARAIDVQAKISDIYQDILIQVNVAKEDTKFGLDIDEVEGVIRDIALLKNVKIRGLMTIAPYVVCPEENRSIFRKLHQILVDINQKNIDNVRMDTLSMGMTHDYIVAVEEGATMLRIGTGIFGERIY